MKRQNAFTLLELLVVMSIVGLALSWVGPLVLEQVDKTKANAEVKQLEQYIDMTLAGAYLAGQPVVLQFNGRQLQRQQHGVAEQVNFDYLFFQPQQLKINANGQLAQTRLQFTSLTKQLEISVGTAIP